ncbi:Protein DEL-7 [Aphelenchoides avenae]|nr:Protein DEL-7 [Aphelenchus avenae]
MEDYQENQTTTLVTIKQDPRMLFPGIVLCPKNPDALNYPAVIADIRKRMPYLDRVTIGKLVTYAIAGAGLDNVDPDVHFITPYIGRLDALFRRWKGRKTHAEFYRDLFETNGYKCEQFFDRCFYASKEFRCCDVFKQHYVMLRGRCFRMRDFYQTDPDATGRLTFFVNQLTSPLADPNGAQPQMIAYIADNHPDVATFPRYYIDIRKNNYIRFSATEIQLFPWNEQCSERPEDKGRASCYVRKWLRTRLIQPFNCTVFYMAHKNPKLDICEPKVLVENYQTMRNNSLNVAAGERVSDLERNLICKPACERFDHKVQFFRSDSAALKGNGSAPFTLLASYHDLEFHRYEEVVVTTVPGFVSQLGGQSALFVGFSVISIVQLFVSVFEFALQKWAEYKNRN